MSKQKVADLNQIVRRLENLLVRHEESENKCRNAKSRKVLNTHLISAQAIERILKSPDIYRIICDGNPEDTQFEDFWKYAASDTRDYIRKIKEHISVLENEENSLEES